MKPTTTPAHLACLAPRMQHQRYYTLPAPAHLALIAPCANTQTYYQPWRPKILTSYYCGYCRHTTGVRSKRQRDNRRRFGTYERDNFATATTFQPLPYAALHCRSSSSSATPAMAPQYHGARHRLPSLFRRSTSPLLPASQFTDH